MISELLIGGSSSVGKTTAAVWLSQRLGLEHHRVDDLVKRLERPELHLLEQGVELWDLFPEELCSRIVRIGHAVAPYLRRRVASLLDAGRPFILEGEGITPDFVAQLASHIAARSVFVVELDAGRLYQTLLTRSASFRSLSEARRRTVAEMNRLYGT